MATTGSLKAGGRFNPPAEFGALYTSLESTTAAKEVVRGLRWRGIDPEEFSEGAWWVYELEVELEAVLDLADANVLERIGIQQGSLTGTELNATREIAAQARQQGYEALLVPSAAVPNSHNLVIFLDRLQTRPNVRSSRPVRFREETL